MTVASLVFGSIIFASIMTLNVRCFPSVAWMEVAQDRGMEIAQGGIDGDGDVWLRWELGRYWWETVLLNKGTLLCIVGARAPKIGATDVPEKL